jgi:hypothetical protein
MSRQNRVNPDHFKIRGRLTADDLARELQKQQRATAAARSGGVAAKARTSRPAKKR